MIQHEDGPAAMVHRLQQATNDHDLDALVGVLRRRLPQRDAGPPGARLHRSRPGPQELEADLLSHPRTSAPRSCGARSTATRCGASGSTAAPVLMARPTSCAGLSSSASLTALPAGPASISNPCKTGAGRRRAVRRQVSAGGSVVILVAGGTGRLGTLVVGRLVSRGLEVRVLTRDPERARAPGGRPRTGGDRRRARPREPGPGSSRRRRRRLRGARLRRTAGHLTGDRRPRRQRQPRRRGQSRRRRLRADVDGRC